MTMNRAKKLAQDALEANKALMEFFDPHIERKIAYDIEMGRMSKEDAGYRADLQFDYEDSTEEEYVFTYKADEGYYGVNYIYVAFTSDFVNDPEGAKVKHEEELEKKRQVKKEQEDRSTRLELSVRLREVEELRAKLEGEKK